MTRSILIILLSSSLLSACSMPHRSASGASSGPILSTSGHTPPAFKPGRADADAFAFGRELRDVDQRIDSARDHGNVSRRQARGLRRQQDQLSDLAARYSSDGLSGDERRELEIRAQLLRDQTAAQISETKKPS